MWQKLMCVVALMLAANAWAGEEIFVKDAWVRESVPGQQSASLQLNLTVTKKARLIGVSSPWAESVEIQVFSTRRGKMEARAVPGVRIPRNRTLVFGKHKLALMMHGLKHPLQAGELVPVSLTVAFPKNRLRTIETAAEVRPLELSYKHYKKDNVYDHR
jgi:periplasmic copper chaperone A